MDSVGSAEGHSLNHALKYGLSNIRAIISFGVVLIIIVFIFVFLYILTLIVLGSPLDSRLMSTAESYLVLLIMAPITCGYMAKCARGLLGGQFTAPDLDRGFKEIVIDGLKLLPLYLVVTIIAWALSFLLGFIINMPDDLNFNLLYSSVLQYAILLIPTIALNFVYMLQIVDYARQGDVLKTVNPAKSINLIIKDRDRSVRAIIAFTIVNLAIELVALAWISLVLTSIVFVIVLILVPFLALIPDMIYIYIVTEFYKGAGKNDKYSPPA